MEDFLNLRLPPWLRRLLTRLIAIVPALIAIVFFSIQPSNLKLTTLIRSDPIDHVY